MTRYFTAVTYDVCEHEQLYEEMNKYPLDLSVDLDKQIREFAKLDIAPLVKVYETDTSDDKVIKFYREYTFKEYECGCNQ